MIVITLLSEVCFMDQSLLKLTQNYCPNGSKGFIAEPCLRGGGGAAK